MTVVAENGEVFPRFVIRIRGNGASLVSNRMPPLDDKELAPRTTNPVEEGTNINIRKSTPKTVSRKLCVVRVMEVII